MARIALVFTVLLLIGAGCGGSDDDDATGLAVSESGEQEAEAIDAGSDSVGTDEAESTASDAGSDDAGSDDAGSDDADDGGAAGSAVDAGVVVEIVEPDGTMPVEREGNTVRANVSGWEDVNVPIWLVIQTPGGRQHPLRTFVSTDGVAIWTQVFLGSDDEDGKSFGLVIASASDGSVGGDELQRLFDERTGVEGLIEMAGIEELARQDVVRSQGG